MKTQKFKLIVSFLLITGLTGFAFAAEVSKSLHNDWKVDQNSVFVLMNKYGKVDIQNWDQQQLSVDVTITVEHPDKEKAAKLLEYLTVEFSTNENELSAITQIDQRFSKLGGSSWGNNKEFSIDFTVKMPKTLDARISNKYGDTFIDELTGYAEINVKYGNLQANKILRGDEKPLSTLVLGYGKATIDEVNWFKVEMKYSKLEIEKSKALVMLTKYSKFYTNEASSIVAESKYDTYDVGKADNFVVEGGYSKYNFDYIGKKLVLETKYSGTTVQKIPATFEEIKINNSYGGIKLGIDDGASYYLKGEAKYAKISFPEGGKMNRIVSSTESSYDGYVGSNPDPAAKVSIYTKYGGVQLDY
jgi:hypothetical protein